MSTGTIVTDNTETLHNALQRVTELEALNKRLDSVVREQKTKIETLDEALNGAHRVIRHLRDGDSVLPVPIP